MNSIKKNLLFLLDFVRHKKSYAQDGEDMALSAFYEGKKGYKGFFVDVGAHHPVRFSNTWHFYRRGWRGINIDPTPGSMRAFKWLRGQDINLEIGVGPEKSNMRFYCFNEPALNTFDSELAQNRNTGKPYRIIKTLEVPIWPLKDVLDSYLPKGQSIDFFSIDVEGLDLAVLQSNDWETYRPRFVLIEDVKFSVEQPLQSEIYQYLHGLHYKMVAVLKRTIIYMDHTQK